MVEGRALHCFNQMLLQATKAQWLSMLHSQLSHRSFPCPCPICIENAAWVLHNDKSSEKHGCLYAGFSTGGTIHIVLNNQVGFTTGPSEARSCPHPSDVGKIVGAPILHVNADDPDAVVQACIIAADWRAIFKRDIVVDIVGYRRSVNPCQLLELILCCCCRPLCSMWRHACWLPRLNTSLRTILNSSLAEDPLKSSALSKPV